MRWFQNTYMILDGSSQIPIGYDCQRGTSYKLTRIGNEISFIGSGSVWFIYSLTSIESHMILLHI